MTPEQVVLVERSLAEVRTVLPDVAADFYRRLFAADPAIRAMFPADLRIQQVKFAATLDDIVGAIRRHPAFLAEAHGLGQRHRVHGVRAAHYQMVGTALLAALGASLGDAWTDEVAHAWRLAYNLIAEAMMAGAAQAV